MPMNSRRLSTQTCSRPGSSTRSESAQQGQGQKGPRNEPVSRGVQVPLDPPPQNQGQGRQGRQGIIFDAAGRQGEKAQDDRSPDEQQPPAAPTSRPGRVAGQKR